MRKLGLTALTLAGLVAAPGCIIEGDVTTVEEGTYSFAWQLTYGGSQYTCEQLGATTVAGRVFRAGADMTKEAALYLDKFACKDGKGTSIPFAVGTYDIALELWNATDQRINPEDAIYRGKTITASVAPLALSVPDAPTAFPVGRRVTFDVDFGAAGGRNCDTGMDGDNGVVLQEVLLSGAGQCVPLFIRFDGKYTGCGTDGNGVCTTTCTDASRALCQGNAVEQVIIDVAEGDYTLEVHGLKGATDATPVVCYSGKKTFKIGAEIENDQATILAPFVGTDPKCEATKPDTGR
jgi:hypothetical protein